MGIIVKRVEEVVADRGSCGTRKRIITSDECNSLGLSQLRIEDARMHLHRYSNEIYYVLDGEGTFEIDDETVPLSQGTVVLIPPGKRHKAISSKDLEVLVIMSPSMAEQGDIVYVE